MNQGFTFVEVLVALLVAALLVSAASSALITSLAAERTAARMQEATLLVPTIASREYLQPGETNGALHADWAVNSDVVETKGASATNTWRMWTMSPKDRPLLTMTFALREE